MMTLRSIRRDVLSYSPRASRVAVEKDGQALVEVALSVCMLAMILLGAVQLGRAAYVAIAVEGAANAAAQYGTSDSTSAADTTGIRNAATADASGVALGDTTASLSCICSDGTASTCKTTDCPASNIETILTVNTQATVDTYFNLPYLPSSITVHGKAVRKVLQ